MVNEQEVRVQKLNMMKVRLFFFFLLLFLFKYPILLFVYLLREPIVHVKLLRRISGFGVTIIDPIQMVFIMIK